MIREEMKQMRRRPKRRRQSGAEEEMRIEARSKKNRGERRTRTEWRMMKGRSKGEER